MLYVNGPYIEFTDPHPVLNCILRHDINCTDFASCTLVLHFANTLKQQVVGRNLSNFVFDKYKSLQQHSSIR